jgi:hypothetical protein
MAEILVKKSELKNIRDGINKMLQSKEQNVIKTPQYAAYETQELSERQKEILKYVEKNPGCTKEDVIKNLDLGSRMTIVKEFQKNAVRRSIDYALPPYLYMYMWRLLEALLMPYKNLIMMYITSDLLLWKERPFDKETLLNKFAVVYGSMKEIHTKLHESITPFFTSQFYQDLRIEPLNTSIYNLESGLSREHIISFLNDYRVFRLRAVAEPVLDILWKISYPVLPHIDQLYASVDREKLKDWRNIISENEEFNYIPKTTQAKNLGKLLH